MCVIPWCDLLSRNYGNRVREGDPCVFLLECPYVCEFIRHIHHQLSLPLVHLQHPTPTKICVYLFVGFFIFITPSFILPFLLTYISFFLHLTFCCRKKISFFAKVYCRRDLLLCVVFIYVLLFFLCVFFLLHIFIVFGVFFFILSYSSCSEN